MQEFQLSTQVHRFTSFCVARAVGIHALVIECRGVLSTGVFKMLVGNRVGLGLTERTISSSTLTKISHHGREKTVLMVVSPWGGDWATFPQAQ